MYVLLNLTLKSQLKIGRGKKIDESDSSMCSLEKQMFRTIQYRYANY